MVKLPHWPKMLRKPLTIFLQSGSSEKIRTVDYSLIETTVSVLVPSVDIRAFLLSQWQ
jgi:hypothetical protein